MTDAFAKARADLAAMPGLKEDELVRLGNCVRCGKPLLDPQASGKIPLFYRVEVTRCGFDAGAIQRRVGLQLLLGSPALASHMGPNADIAKIIDGPHRVVVHENCAGTIAHVLDLMPKQEHDEPAAAGEPS